MACLYPRQKTPLMRRAVGAYSHTPLLDAFVAMPNHLHGTICVSRAVGAYSHTPLRGDASVPFRSPSKTIGAVVRGFKFAVTSRVNNMRGTPGQPVWQRNYYEHVIRDEHDLNLVRSYIATNPLRWALDNENPDNMLAATQESPLFAWER
jgi:putative transposase